MANDLLSLPTHPRAGVFLELVKFLKRDPTLNTLIRPKAWFVWDGQPDTGGPFTTSLMPCIRITPQGSPIAQVTPVRRDSPFHLSVDIAVASLNIVNLLNFWGAFEMALFPGDGAQSVRQALQAVYPEAYTVNLYQPAIAPSLDAAGSSFLQATGMISIEMMIKN